MKRRATAPFQPDPGLGPDGAQGRTPPPLQRTQIRGDGGGRIRANRNRAAGRRHHVRGSCLGSAVKRGATHLATRERPGVSHADGKRCIFASPGVAFNVLRPLAMSSTWFSASLGGVLIGVASALLLVAHGRIAGISGITGELLRRATPDRAWRLAFVGGLAGSGAIAAIVAPGAIGAPVRSIGAVLVAGLLVGFGTRLGGGCTSGHGVCGISRGSRRSLVAVATFMATGAITAILAGRLL
jgi:hypothetical protein